MILIDTSVLIDFLKERNTEAVQKFDSILQNKIPYGINAFVYQELLQGAATEKDFIRLKTYLDSQIFYKLQDGRASYASAAKLYFQCRKAGIVIRSTIDCLIAQTAIENNLDLLHSDKDFDRMATVIKKLKIYR